MYVPVKNIFHSKFIQFKNLKSHSFLIHLLIIIQELVPDFSLFLFVLSEILFYIN